MPPDSEGNPGLNPSCVSAGEVSHESSGLNGCCAEDYVWMQEAASKFSIRNELIPFFFFPLKYANTGSFPWPQSSEKGFCVGTSVTL